jgi:hypothetical protein
MSQPEKHFHAVQFYKDEASLAGTVARFLAEGIAAAEPGLVIATAAHADIILRELAALGQDVATLRETGELQFFDARKVLLSFMVADLPDPILFRSRVGELIEQVCGRRLPCPIRAYGEMVDLLWQEGNCDGAIKLEILWNELATTYEFSLLCGYAFGHFYKETRDPRYQDVCKQHSHVIASDAGRPNPTTGHQTG